ncbi:VOC family protein [Trichococcus sp. K1Tr]|uniref:VOC family protein n=1 Tax=Trichococcus sp. K1Tr TaxID=3020847 RepID=UPI002FE43942
MFLATWCGGSDHECADQTEEWRHADDFRCVPGREFHTGNHISLTLTYDDVEEARTVFNRLADGGSIGMELQQTFWSPLYGSLTDRYGVEWQISVDGA